MQGGSLDVSGLKEEADCGEEVRDKWELGFGAFFSSVPQELMAIVAYRRWKQDCVPQRALL